MVQYYDAIRLLFVNIAVLNHNCSFFPYLLFISLDDLFSWSIFGEDGFWAKEELYAKHTPFIHYPYSIHTLSIHYPCTMTRPKVFDALLIDGISNEEVYGGFH